MVVKKFLEMYNYAPYDLTEIAEIICGVPDNCDLTKMANAFLEIKEDFEIMLDDIGFEFG